MLFCSVLSRLLACVCPITQSLLDEFELIVWATSVILVVIQIRDDLKLRWWGEIRREMLGGWIEWFVEGNGVKSVYVARLWSLRTICYAFTQGTQQKSGPLCVNNVAILSQKRDDPCASLLRQDRLVPETRFPVCIIPALCRLRSLLHLSSFSLPSSHALFSPFITHLPTELVIIID